jgi:peptidoglycan/LPS O-acetylase OafA/YrhL
MRSRDAIMPQVKNQKLSSWDVVYALNMAIACLITYWIMTHTLSRFVDEFSDFLGGMWSVVATVMVFRETRLRSLSAGIALVMAAGVSCALCLLYLLLFPFTPVGMAALIAIGTLVMTLSGRRDDIVKAPGLPRYDLGAAHRARAARGCDGDDG